MRDNYLLLSALIEVRPLQVQASFIRPVIIGGIMTFVVTAVITFINLGLQPDYLRRWMIAWAMAWPIATLAAFVAVPVADRVTGWIVGKLDKAGER